jgi:hypothetical protein
MVHGKRLSAETASGPRIKNPVMGNSEEQKLETQ